MPKSSAFKKATLFLASTAVLILLLILFCNWKIKHDTQAYTFTQPEHLPYNRVGLVLGTSDRLQNGSPNPYFEYRIEAAAALYRHKKVDFLIVSGDNSEKYYNEPAQMQEALVRQGVPKDKIYLDYAGFRTLDSVVRCREIFGQSQFTIVSQAFHNQRALFIAQHYGMDAVGLNARDVTGANGFKTHFREVLARVKVFLDLYLLNKQPKYLGEKVEIR